MLKRFLLCISISASFASFAQNVGINSSGAAADASAMLDIVSSDKGLLIPRVALTMTSSALPVTAPTTSLLVYNTATVADVTPGYYYWDGAAWSRLLDGTATDNDWTVSGTDQYSAVSGNVGIGTTTPGSKLTVGTDFATINGITVGTNNTSNSQLIARKAANKTAFGLLAWENQTFMSSGVYYDGATWVHHNSNVNNQIFALEPGIGSRWWASNTGAGSWNISNAETLWDDGGSWKNLVQSTQAGNSYFTGGNVAIGNTTPGSRLSVGTNFATITGITVGTNNTTDAQFVARKAANKTAFSVLAWEAQTYLSSGIYYDGGTWVHHNANNNNQLINLQPGAGARWYASNNGAGSWNVSSNEVLWDDGANWKNLVQSTQAGDSYYTGGNVGVGTAAPSATLDVEGSFQLVDGTEGNGKVLTSDALGNASWQTPTTVSSGSYSPTFAGVSNYVSSVNSAGLWMRTGNIVNVSFTAQITVSASGSPTQFTISLPVATNITSVLNDLQGTVVGEGVQTSGTIEGRTPANAGFIQLIPQTVSSQTTYVVKGSFQYVVQ